MNSGGHTPLPGSAAVEFRNVSIGFDDRPVLTQLSFALLVNRLICITGASGSGKSVLVRLAIGLLRPDQGHVLIEGTDLASLDEPALLQLRSDAMGVVFQDSSLFTSMSVLENAAYRLTERGLNDDDAERAALEVLTFVGLERDTEKLPEELSIGMGRRLEFARALVGWPRVLLLDEPNSGLDPLNARNILDLVIRARESHKVSVLLVTKEPWEIRYLANHSGSQDEQAATAQSDQSSQIQVIVLDAGKIAFSGTPKQLASSNEPAVTRMMQGGLARVSRLSTANRNPWPAKRSSKYRLF
jgi:phospholipid/cholesterol/gamma-HCH transport system ATP-binding protein